MRFGLLASGLLAGSFVLAFYVDSYLALLFWFLGLLIYASVSFYQWFKSSATDIELGSVLTLKTSEPECVMLCMDGGSTFGSEQGDSVTSSHSEYPYPSSEASWIRSRLSHLESTKADKDVVKSENRRLMDRVESVTGEIDEVKGRMLVAPVHTCLMAGDIGEMKKSIEATKDLAKAAIKTANLTSTRGYRILIGLLAGLITLGSATVVWAVNVMHSAEDAKATSTALAKRVETFEDRASTALFVDAPALDPSQKSPRSPLSAPQTYPTASQVSLDQLLDEAISRAISAALDRAVQSGQFGQTDPVPNPGQNRTLPLDSFGSQN